MTDGGLMDVQPWIDTLAALISAGAAIAGALVAVRNAQIQGKAPRRLVLLTGALLLAGVAGTYAGIRILTSDQQSPAARGALTLLVDPRLRPGCKEADFDADRILARITCDDSDDRVNVTFALYADPRQAEAVLTRHAEALNAPTGDCLRDEFATGRFADAEGPDAGSLLCYRDGERLTLEWTSTRLGVLARATQPHRSRRSILEWWRDEGGLSRTNARRAFPDDYEVKLRARVPKAFQDRCRRSVGWAPREATATLRCDLHNGADTAWYIQFPTLTSLQKYYDASNNSLRTIKGSCSTKETVPLEAAYRDGRRACYTDDKGSWMEWTDEGLLIYAYAFRKEKSDRSLSTLWDWWDDAGPS